MISHKIKIRIILKTLEIQLETYFFYHKKKTSSDRHEATDRVSEKRIFRWSLSLSLRDFARICVYRAII